MNAKSIAQFVAKRGLKPDPVLSGEVEQLRVLNRYFRGRNAIVRKGGLVYDVLEMDARAEGFHIESTDHFFEMLEADAVAIWEGDDDARVWPMDFDYEFDNAAIWEDPSREGAE